METLIIGDCQFQFKPRYLGCYEGFGAGVEFNCAGERCVRA